jgi:uncharacterized glyoxalase superfamily protein PhnB
MDKIKVLEITPIPIVDRIEPSLELWIGRLGFEKTVEVPHEGTLGFTLLVSDSHPVMMQTGASIAADSESASQAIGESAVALYIDVESLDAALASTRGLSRVMEVRETFYGAREFAVRDPSGHVLIFAEKIQKT